MLLGLTFFGASQALALVGLLCLGLTDANRYRNGSTRSCPLYERVGSSAGMSGGGCAFFSRAAITGHRELR